MFLYLIRNHTYTGLLLKKKKYIKLALLLAGSLTVMSGATIAPALPELKRAFADTANIEYLSRLVLTLPALSIAIISPFAGWWITRYSKTKTLYASMLLYGLAGASGFVLNDLYAILVGRLFLGVAVAFTMTVASTLIGDYFEGKERNAFMGAFTALLSLGGVVYIALGGALADITWRGPFLVYLASLLFLPITIFSLFEPERNNGSTREEKKQGDVAGITILIILATGFFVMLFFYLVPTQLPFILVEQIGMSNSGTGYAIAFGNLVAAGVSFLYDKYKRWFGYMQLYAIAFAANAAGYFILSQSNVYWMVLIGLALSAAGMGIMMPNTALWLLDSSTNANRGKLMGGMSSAYFLGQFVSPLYSQPIVNMLGVPASFYVTSIVMVVFSIGFGLKGFVLKKK